MSYQEIEVTPNPNNFGAAITGCDLKRELSPAAVSEIRQAWLAHQVVFFPGQDLSMEELENFTLYLGEFGYIDYIKSVDGHPYVLELRREPEETASHFASSWHSDNSYQTEPPSATLLLSKVTPPQGGDTLFADCIGAYKDLSDEMKEKLGHLRGIHSAIMPYSKDGFYGQDTEKRSITFLPNDSAKDQEIHPVIRTHPETGRKSIYCDSVYTIGIEGMEDGEARDLIGLLHVHTTQDKYVYRHKWQKDMLTIWDNRSVQHYADAGFDGHRRVMWRTTVVGDKPF